MEENKITEKLVDDTFLLTDFNKQALKDFFDFSKATGHKTIYLSSLGGSGAIMVAIADIINQKPDEYTIKITELNCSSSFNLCLHAKCQIQEICSQYQTPPSHLWHSCQFDSKDWEKHEIKDLAIMDSRTFNLIKHVLTKKQVKKRERFVRWAGRFLFLRKFMDDNTYLTNDQMKELLGERYTVI